MKKYVSAVALRAALLTALVCAVGSTAYAQSLPSPWLGADIGSPTPSGSSTYSSGVFTINAGGEDIWNGSDQFRFVYQQVSGNVDIIARVDSLLVTDAYAKAGLMIRASLSASSAHGTAVVTGSTGIRYSRRLTTGASTTNLYGPGLAAPVWLRLTRVGSRVTTYYSTTGTSWTLIGYEDNIALGTSAYVGIAASSHNYGALTTAKVSNVAVVGQGVTAAAPPPPAGLPDGQQSVDIGGPAIAGSTTYSGGIYTVKAAGSDIWGASDQFRFVYRPVTGNVEVVARVNSIALAHNWSKAGVMIRESLTGASRHASTFMSAGKGYAFQRRFDTGGHSVHTRWTARWAAWLGQAGSHGRSIRSLQLRERQHVDEVRFRHRGHERHGLRGPGGNQPQLRCVDNRGDG